MKEKEEKEKETEEKCNGGGGKGTNTARGVNTIKVSICGGGIMKTQSI